MVLLFLLAAKGLECSKRWKDLYRLKSTEELSLQSVGSTNSSSGGWAIAKAAHLGLCCGQSFPKPLRHFKVILFQIFRSVGTTGCLSILHFEPHTASFTAVNTWWGGRSLLWVLLFLGSLFNGLLKQFQQTNIKATAFVPHWECIHLAFFEAISLWECLCAVVAVPLVLVALKCVWQHSAPCHSCVCVHSLFSVSQKSCVQSHAFCVCNATKNWNKRLLLLFIVFKESQNQS